MMLFEGAQMFGSKRGALARGKRFAAVPMAFYQDMKKEWASGLCTAGT